MICQQCHGAGYVTQPGDIVTAKTCGCLDSCGCDSGWHYVTEGFYDFAKPCPKCTDLRKMARIVNMATMPSRYIGSTIMDIASTSQSAAGQVAKWYGEHAEGGPGFTLRGHVGTGKTHAATAVLWRLISDQVYVRFTHVGELLKAMKGMMDNDRSNHEDTLSDLYRFLSRVPVLLLDELDGLRTDWEKQQIADILQARYNGALTTLITTNLDEDGVAGMFGDWGRRVTSRITQMSPTIWFGGDDYRRTTQQHVEH